MTKVSIIIRTKNEERWIGHCLKMVFAQSHKDLEVILVDNASTDNTVGIAKRFPMAKIINIDAFKPGAAINAGIRQSTGQFLVCISAHCVPQTAQWLSALLKNFDDTQVAGVYGRQLPMSFSEPSDKRDLLITFGLDRRVQVKDYFFHNANSMIRRSVWEKIPFDEAATNIEDRIWGKAVIEAGHKLVYEPEAAVYHHHGIHQDNDRARARSVVSVIEKFEKDAHSMPDSWKAENCNIAAVVPLLGNIKRIEGCDLLSSLTEKLRKSKYVKKIYLLSENDEVKKFAKNNKFEFIERPEWLASKEKTIEDVLQYALTQMEAAGNHPEAILYANYLHPFRPERLFEELIEDLQYKGLDSVFAGFSDYQNFWVKNGDGAFTQVGEGLKPRENKQPLYESLYGLGCVTTSQVIRSGRIVGGRIGILPLDDRIFTIRYDDEKSRRLIEAIYRQFGNEKL